MIPSGYKEDVVYCPKPTDGSGDLTFTRASDGTRVNSSGLVENVPWNLVKQSEQFNASPWVLDNGAGTGSIAVTNNYATAPNGTLTADRLQLVKGSVYAQTYQPLSVISGAQYTLSVYLKSLSGTPTITTFFDTTPLGKKTITTEWVRYDFTFVASTSTVYPLIGLHTTDSATADILAWGYQVNQGSTAKPYFPTTDRQNVPRLTYEGGCPSLLLEPQRTNLLTYSEQFDNAAWTNYDRVTQNSVISPSGAQDGSTFTVLSTVSFLGQNPTLTSSTPYSFSIYAKKGNWDIFRIGNGSSSTNAAWFDLTNGTTGNQVGGTSKIEAVGNDWYRCSYTTSNPNIGGTYSFFVNLSTAMGATSSPGDGSTMSFYAAQIEEGSYPTSYIGPTTSAAVTRVADAAYKTGISSLIGQTEGTMFLDFVLDSVDGGNDFRFSVTEGALYNNEIFIGMTNGYLRAFMQESGSAVYDSGNISAIVGTRYKMALAYANNDVVFYVNGTQKNISSSATIPNTDEITIGNRTDSKAMVVKETVNQAALFKTRLTNTELAALTTL